jgi:hypothetical protein
MVDDVRAKKQYAFLNCSHRLHETFCGLLSTLQVVLVNTDVQPVLFHLLPLLSEARNFLLHAGVCRIPLSQERGIRLLPLVSKPLLMLNLCFVLDLASPDI